MNEELHNQYQKLLALLQAASKVRLLHLEPALEEAALFFELVAEEVKEAPEAKKQELQQMIANIDQVLKDATTAGGGSSSQNASHPQRDEERMRKALARMLKASTQIKKAFGEEAGAARPEPPSPKKPPSDKRPRHQKKGWMKS